MEQNKKLELDEIRKIQIRLLKKFIYICEKEKYRYTVVGGTFLGAIRHKGYIPWDDDIDVGMPREDYEKFIVYCKNETMDGEEIITHENPKYNYLFAKFCDKNTILFEPEANRKNCVFGVYIDVFPIDGLGNSYEKAKKVFDRTYFLRNLLVSSCVKYPPKFRKNIFKLLESLMFYVLSRFVNEKKIIKKIEKVYVNNGFDNSLFSGVVCGCYGKNEIMGEGSLRDLATIEFENIPVKSIKNFHEYLSRLYGDYMQLPPPENRVRKHLYEAFPR